LAIGPVAPVSAPDFSVQPFPQAGSRRYPMAWIEPAFPSFEIRLDGPIEPEDAMRPLAIFEDRVARDDLLAIDYAPILGLDSSGGDFREGIEIGRVSRDFGTPTPVERDAFRVSARAVAFMADRRYEIESDPRISRYLEGGGWAFTDRFSTMSKASISANSRGRAKTMSIGQ